MGNIDEGQEIIKSDNEILGKEKVHIFHNINPFMQDVVEYVQEKKYRKAVGSKYQQVLNEDTGELQQQKVLVLGEQKTVDKQEYYKMFHGSIKSFFNLSKGGGMVFEYIMKNITYSRDRICVNAKEVACELGVSTSSVYKSITNLLDNKILAKAEREGCYFINPTVAFKGDRITLVKQYILSKDKEISAGIVSEPETEYGENN